MVAYIHWNEVNFSLPCLKAPRAPGAYCLLSTQWFQVQWRSDWAATGIAAKEMFPLVLVWGSSCCGQTITFKSDNTVVVQALSSNSARTHTYPLLRAHFHLRLPQPTLRACVILQPTPS